VERFLYVNLQLYEEGGCFLEQKSEGNIKRKKPKSKPSLESRSPLSSFKNEVATP
jgi:hypothetical protein